ncbi:unnamed protein product [Albugo candida]|uniref:Uncharacterized protein n=1 Tax=Albugo candida TaxID=65357 RepID=A0A024FXD1_9STRA|nr:unnamed protein product [Albugo candida]|eukprot:CCI11681.1 unnamed protein product [Albugo candida]
MGGADSLPSVGEDSPDRHLQKRLAELPQMLTDVHAQDVTTQLNEFRKLLSIERNPPIKEVI